MTLPELPFYIDPFGLWVRPRYEQLANKIRDGTATEQDKNDFRIWSPFIVPIEPLTMEKALLLLVVAKYMKTPEGMKQLSDLAKKYLTVVGDSMSALAQAGGTNAFSSLVHGKITVAVYETLGLIPPLMARTLMSNMEDCINKIMIQKMLGEIASVGTMVFGKAVPAVTAKSE